MTDKTDINYYFIIQVLEKLLGRKIKALRLGEDADVEGNILHARPKEQILVTFEDETDQLVRIEASSLVATTLEGTPPLLLVEVEPKTIH